MHPRKRHGYFQLLGGLTSLARRRPILYLSVCYSDPERTGTGPVQSRQAGLLSKHTC
jgi:hypothetical protein